MRTAKLKPGIAPPKHDMLYALGGTIEAALIAGVIAFYTARARPTIKGAAHD